eukprot:14597-Chlamydomonas_euryale.AAC.1
MDGEDATYLLAALAPEPAGGGQMLVSKHFSRHFVPLPDHTSESSDVEAAAGEDSDNYASSVNI